MCGADKSGYAYGMSESELVREKIAYLKFWLGVIVAVGVSLVGWLISHLHTSSWPLLTFGVIALLPLATGAWVLHKMIQRRIHSLRDL